MKVILTFGLLGFVAVVSAKEYTCPSSSEGQEITYIPNEEDCTTYYICLNGMKVLSGCTKGQLFDVKTLTCRPKDQAQCAGGEPEPEEPEPEPEVPCVQCPPQTSIDDDILLPNVKNCSTFYHCSHGIAYLQSCPKYLQFNKKKKQCDYPNEAKCVASETC